MTVCQIGLCIFNCFPCFFFFLQSFDETHQLSIPLSRSAVHEQDIDNIHIQLEPEAVDDLFSQVFLLGKGQFGSAVAIEAGIQFGEDGDLIMRNVL